MISVRRGLVCSLALCIAAWGCQPVLERSARQAESLPPPVAADSAPLAEPAAKLREEAAPKDDARAKKVARAERRVSAGRALALAPSPAERELDTEAYSAIEQSSFTRVTDAPLSTFSIDVDTASYSNVRRFIAQGQLPPEGAVRIEELLNYFPYAYAAPAGDSPIAINTELSAAPWKPEHRLLHVGLSSRPLATSELPPRNLVFLVDVSGSMSDENKLPLLRRSLGDLVETLSERDRVAMVVYAGATGLVLEPTRGDRRASILEALDRLQAGGSTNGGDGIQLAYAVASRMYEPGSSNRVILATDGDFNVGVTSHSELVSLIEEKRQSGVYLSVLGFGMGNYKDSTLELLADKGNGNYAYIDSLAEARKVLIKEAGATLVTLAKDVKLQLEFNPEHVAAYRLIGYENRRLEARDFNDDRKDAGELGAGHSVTALYEIVPPGVPFDGTKVDPLRYQVRAPQPGAESELCTLKVRFKRPHSASSQLLERIVADKPRALERTSDDFRFSAAVAVFGMSFGSFEHRGSSSFTLARQLAQGALGPDPGGYRREFVGLVDSAQTMSR